jgi:hypothetical protein
VEVLFAEGETVATKVMAKSVSFLSELSLFAIFSFCQYRYFELNHQLRAGYIIHNCKMPNLRYTKVQSYIDSNAIVETDLHPPSFRLTSKYKLMKVHDVQYTNI